MTGEINKENLKIFAEGRGKYSVVDDKKVYNFDFPINTTLETNLSIVSFIKTEIQKTLEEKEKLEKENKEKEKK